MVMLTLMLLLLQCDTDQYITCHECTLGRFVDLCKILISTSTNGRNIAAQESKPHGDNPRSFAPVTTELPQISVGVKTPT